MTGVAQLLGSPDHREGANHQSCRR
jgi:hypothetical protein